MNIDNLNFNYLICMLRKQVVIVFFFIFFFSSLFLGDGKQPFVDVWWALGILIMYGFRYYQRGKLDLLPLPRLIRIAWTALIIYYIVLIPFSDSPGYSISATIRLIEGYLVYVLFSTLVHDSRNQKVEFFVKGLLFVGSVATAASFVFLLNPSFARLLPPMNLLYANYGHNHLAGLLLFMFPVAIGAVEKKKNIWAIGALGLFSVGFILTFARGAWILLVFYLLFLVVRNKSTTTRRVGLLVTVAATLALLGVSLISLKEPTHRVGFVGQLVRQAQKTTLFEDNRWEYWRQSIEAIKERPLFGSGPGTFYLESKRFQSHPNNWSWFAHSLPLQTGVEIGIVGLVLTIFLLWFLIRGASKGPLFAGVLLLLLYGIYEFIFDYASLWIVFWASLGLITNKSNTKNDDGSTRTDGVFLSIFVLIIFYSSYLTSLIATTLNLPRIAFYTAPYSVDAARAGRLGPREVTIARAMHQRNTEVVSSLYQDKKIFNREEKKHLLDSVAWDPKNIESAMRAANIFSRTNNLPEEIAIYRHLKNQQMTSAQRTRVYDGIIKFINRTQYNDVLLLDAYEIAFFFNQWDSPNGHTLFDPREKVRQLIQFNNTSEATRVLARFLSLWPVNVLSANTGQKNIVVEVGFMLADLVESEGHIDDAIAIAQKALVLDAKNPELIKKIAWLSLKKGDLSIADAVQKKCEIEFSSEQWCSHLVVDRDLAQHWKSRALEDLKHGNDVGGIEKLRLAAAAYPFGGEYYRPLIEALVRLGYPDEAKEVVQRCIEHNKKYNGGRWCNDFIKRQPK